jgi:hypothetical protein
MPECAYCSYVGKLSREHIISKWISGLSDGMKYVEAWDTDGFEAKYQAKIYDLAPRVVCAECNKTWMSNIESKYAKPFISPLILGETGIPISPSCARALAYFAFNIAVTLDYKRENAPSFFPRPVRHAFRESLEIPENVHMWMFSRTGADKGVSLHAGYFASTPVPTCTIEIYSCTMGIGSFGFQVATVNQLGNGVSSISPEVEFDHLAVPFWPLLPIDLVWPIFDSIRSENDLTAFSLRWKTLSWKF